MNTNSKALHGQDASLKGYNPEAKREQFQQPQQLPQQNITIEDIIQAGQELTKAMEGYRTATPEPRVMQHRIALSVPNCNPARLRKTGSFI